MTNNELVLFVKVLTLTYLLKKRVQLDQ